MQKSKHHTHDHTPSRRKSEHTFSKVMHTEDPESPSERAHTTLNNTAKAWYHTRNGKIGIGIGTFAILVAGAALYTYLASRHHIEAAPNNPTPTPTSSETPKPITKEAPLTGVLVDPELISKPVIGVVVENLDPDARPQSGLSQAGVVYEALAEGGITRYVAFYQTEIPADIGPVRSLRPVFYQMGMEYNAPVAHIGGSTDGLALARSGSGFKDMDQFYNSTYFRRIPTRWAPHNVYIYGPSLVKMVTDKGWATAPTFTPWKRKDDAPSNSPNATSVTADFSTSSYLASFTYQAATNSYVRSIAGRPDVDAARDNAAVNPKTVIVLYAATTFGTQPNGKPKTDIDLLGTGKAVVFQDGNATECSWRKASDSDRLVLIDSAGQEISLNRGQSWVSIIPSGRSVTWK